MTPSTAEDIKSYSYLKGFGCLKVIRMSALKMTNGPGHYWGSQGTTCLIDRTMS